MYTIQMVLVTLYFLKVISLEELSLWEWGTEYTAQGQGEA